MDEQFDPLERHCPRLGGPVTFLYCRRCDEGNRPCWKIVDCWWESLDIVSFLQKNMPPETFQKFMQARPKPKLASLVELIEQAQKRII
jgi:hypothetical protein